MAFGRPDVLQQQRFTSEQCDQEINELLLSGQAKTASEAENLFLDSRLPELARLVAWLTDDEAPDHEVVKLLLRHGSRPWEDEI